MTGLRVGVFGVGRLGAVHARILDEMAGVSLAGIADADRSRAAEVAALRGVPAHTSAAELAGRIDAAIVAVPTSAHHAVATLLLDAGVHVLVEKPIAATLAETDDLIARARAAGCLLAAGHVERFNRVLRACQPFLEAPRFISCQRLARFQPRGTDVSVALDLMIHDIDLAIELAGDVVDSVEALGVRLLSGGVDMANARLRFAGGAVADLNASRASLAQAREVRIFQASGYFSLDLAAGRGEFFRRRAESSLDPARVRGVEDIVEVIPIIGVEQEPLRAELEAFIAAIRGQSSGVATADEARAALAIALEVQSQIEAADHATA